MITGFMIMLVAESSCSLLRERYLYSKKHNGFKSGTTLLYNNVKNSSAFIGREQ